MPEQVETTTGTVVTSLETTTADVVVSAQTTTTTVVVSEQTTTGAVVVSRSAPSLLSSACPPSHRPDPYALAAYTSGVLRAREAYAEHPDQTHNQESNP